MDIQENIKKFSEQELKRLKLERPKIEDSKDDKKEPNPEPVDIYQRNLSKRNENARKSFPRGSSAIVNAAVENVVRGDGYVGLAHAYKKAKDDSELLKKKGDRERAEIVRQQYMDERFIPAIEVVVNYTTPDEVLNSKQALEALDKYAFVEGAGKGYTASYIRQAYGNQLGQEESHSDDSMRLEIAKINCLLDDGQVRPAYGIAAKLKKQIDDGERIASDDDYDLLGRIVAFYG